MYKGCKGDLLGLNRLRVGRNFVGVFVQGEHAWEEIVASTQCEG